MTIEKMHDVVQHHCDNIGDCDHCELKDLCASIEGMFDKNPAVCVAAYQLLTANNLVNDPVNHPSHYETGKFECIEVMEEVFGVEAVKNFCLCNAFKYLYRTNRKNGLEDVKKCHWYVSKYLEIIGREESEH
jgi:hypothetical protein